jgi:hypothetical protein
MFPACAGRRMDPVRIHARQCVMAEEVDEDALVLCNISESGIGIWKESASIVFGQGQPNLLAGSFGRSLV